MSSKKKIGWTRHVFSAPYISWFVVKDEHDDPDRFQKRTIKF